MNKINCPHCGKEVTIEASYFPIDPEIALLELFLAQLAAVYRNEFKVGFPTEGEADIEALQWVLVNIKSDEEKLSIDSVANVMEMWRDYLRKKGQKGTIPDFVHSWIPAQDPGAKVIPFRPRNS